MEDVKAVVRELHDRRLAPRRVRLAAIEDVADAVASHAEDLPAPLVRALLGVIFSTASAYHDRESRQEMRNLLATLLRRFSDTTTELAVPLLSALAAQLSRIQRPEGGHAVALGWTTQVTIHGHHYLDTHPSAASSLIHAQAELAASVLGHPGSLARFARKLLARELNQHKHLPPFYLKVLLQAPAEVESLPLLSLIVTDVLQADADMAPLLAEHKEALLKAYVQNVITAKSCKRLSVLNACQGVLSIAEATDFETTLLPAAQRALKRNADVALHHLLSMVEQMQMDLSAYVVELVSSVHPFLTSNIKPEHRTRALQIVEAVFRKCSAPSRVIVAVEELAALLSSKTSKLPMWEQRQAVYDAITSASRAPLPTTGFEQLGSGAVELLLPILAKEPHEDTHVRGLQTLTALVRPMRSVPSALVARAREALKPASNTPAVIRTAVLHLASAAFGGERLTEASVLLSELTKLLEQAPSQRNNAAGQAQIAAAGHLMLRLVGNDAAFEARLLAGECSFWTKLESGAVFTSRFFRQATLDEAEEYLSLACLAMTLETQRSDAAVAKASLTGWADGVVELLLHGAWRVRRSSAQRLSRYLAGAAPMVPEALLFAFKAAIAAQACVRAEEAQAAAALAAVRPQEGRGMQLHRPVLDSASHAPVIALHSICTRSAACDDDAARALLRAAVLPAYHPLVTRASHPIFPAIVRRFGFDPATFLQEEAAYLHEHFIDALMRAAARDIAHDDADAVARAVTHFTTLPGFDALKQMLVKRVLQELRSPQLLAVTKDDVGVLVTPEGELYDRSFLPKSDQEDLRKNSKDYHDLKWERELRKELAQKKGLKVDGPKLSKQQQELSVKTLAKEAQVRERLRVLEQQCTVAFRLLEALLSSYGNPSCLADSVPVLTPALLRAAKMSHLATSDACQAFIRLGHTLTRLSPGLAHSLARATLRASDVAAPLPAEWGLEPVEAMAGRIARELWGITHESEPLDDTAMAYCFPLLQYVLTVDSDEMKVAAREDAMVFLNDHAELGRSRHLQRYTFLGLLVHVMLHHPRVAHQAGMLMVTFAEHMGAAARDGTVPLKANEVSVLLEAYYSAQQQLRQACLEALAKLPLTPDEEMTAVVWVARHDPDAACADAGAQLWDALALTLPAAACEELLEPLASEHAPTRTAAASALGAALELHTSRAPVMVTLILDRYADLLVVPEPVRDAIGNIVSEPFEDPWPSRAGLAKGLAAMAPNVPPSELPRIFEFFVQCALGDPSSDAQGEVLGAGLALIDVHGQEHRAELLPIFERFLATKSRSTEQDLVRQGAVVLLGALAKHLAKDDPKIPAITDTLIGALRTPSQPVQEAVCKCLPPLVQATKQRGPELTALLLDQLLESPSYGERRGAAYGLAGVVKGLGLLALKQQGVMARLLEAIQDENTPRHREGALMAFELLCGTLGRFFEPYVGQVLPHLLACFGDAKRDVRAATQDTAKAIMGELTGHGVKLVLPSLLDALEDESWRTKQGSAQLLGAMAYCAPKQLSSCLPRVVPKLVEVLTDSHPKVQSAGKAALKSIGSVIRNPEIAVLVPTILKALNDSDAHAKKALDKLLNTAFVHVIDAPSLALIMPIIERALRDRHTELKKRSAQIVGNMYSLTDAKDLVPYMVKVLPGLKNSLVDPVPEVRGVAARALGAMVKGMGESHFTELVPWMLETLSADVSSVDRAGAAQGLSEVLAGLGVARLESMMPGFLANTEHTAPFVREGHLMLFVYLPATFGSEFRPFVASIIPPVLRGLSDVEEPVRATAMRAGQRIINSYAEDCIELLLPQLMEGLQDENWRIRESSVQLLGDLLYLLSGTSGKKTTATSEDDNFGTEASRQRLIDTLGMDLRNRVLAGVYMARQDVSLPVRQASVHVWKVVVTHTVRTLREILPSLISMLLLSLASRAEDRRAVGGRTLGELVRKLGERILPEILPMLHEELGSDDATTRQGVCVGLGEIMRSLTREQAEEYENTLVPAVQLALSDSLPAVREEAAQTFAVLHTTVGNQAIEAVLPGLLNQLEDVEASAGALDSLQRIMSAKSRAMLPFLVPKLTEQPVSAFNARALAHLTAVAGEALDRHLGEIIEALLTTLESGASEEGEHREIVAAAVRVVLSVGQTGLTPLVADLTKALRSESDTRRLAGAQILAEFCQGTKVDLEEEMEELLFALLQAFADQHPEVVHAAWGGLAAVVKAIKRDQVTCMRRILSQLRDLPRNGQGEVAGLAIPRGPEPLLPLFLDSLEISHPEAQQLAVEGLGALAELTAPDALEDFARAMCGKLIRKLNDPNAKIKLAALMAMRTMLAKLGVKIKSFVPQLQPSFLKTLMDPLPAVRTGSVRLLTELLQVMPAKNVDRLVRELAARCEKQSPPELESTLHAVHTTLFHAPESPAEEELSKVQEALVALLEGRRDPLLAQAETVREPAGRAFGMLGRHVKDDAALVTLLTPMLTVKVAGANWFAVQGYAEALAVALAMYPERVFGLMGKDAVLARVTELAMSDNVSIAVAGVACASSLLRSAALSADVVDDATMAKVVKTTGAALKALVEDKDALEEALLRLKRALKLVRAPARVEMQKQLVPVLLSLARAAPVSSKRTIDRIIIHAMGLRPKTAAKTVEDYSESTNAGAAEEMRRHFQRSTERYLGERTSDETEVYYGPVM